MKRSVDNSVDCAVQRASVLSFCRQSSLLRPVYNDRHLRQQRRAGRRRSRPRILVPQLRPQLFRLRLHGRFRHRNGPEGNLWPNLAK